KFEIVDFMAKLIATILPALENFNISAAIATGAEVPTKYVGLAALYAICYSAIALFAALIMFEDRDLA
ncbi:MAG: ABC transporter permease, partial [Planctomycetaceae bacterium]|nr:ABC transporter permease [Planctomycetaceae bacterium]